LFPPLAADDDFIFLCKYYCPEDGVKFRSNRDKVPYVDWAASGMLTATPGNTIDYDYIKQDILRAHEIYEVLSWNYDPMFATEISSSLFGSGLPVVPFRQTTYLYNEAIMKLEEIILKSKLNKGQDPILDWMFENIAINRSRSGLVMFDKDRSQEKIDGMVCLAMCMGKQDVGGYLDGGKSNRKVDVDIFFV